MPFFLYRLGSYGMILGFEKTRGHELAASEFVFKIKLKVFGCFDRVNIIALNIKKHRSDLTNTIGNSKITACSKEIRSS